jgi:hypothetical protein
LESKDVELALSDVVDSCENGVEVVSTASWRPDSYTPA